MKNKNTPSYQQALRLIEECKATKSKKLDLGYCGLETIPEEVFECTWLEKLNLCNAYFDYEKREWVQSSNNGEPNLIREIPFDIQALQNLKSLFAGGGVTKDGSYIRYSISDISSINSLRQLQSLYLSSNKINDIEGALEDLQQLQNLYLGNNQINDVNELGKLDQLQSFYFGNNLIENLSAISKLKKLHSLDLRNNQITKIEALGKLTKLHKLDLRNNKIDDIATIKDLKLLRSLDLRSNLISNIEVLGELKDLYSLDLRSNQIRDIKVLGGLKQLQSLDLRNNHINNIDVLAGLHQLQSLDLGNNQIIDTSALANLKQLRNLDLRSNLISDVKVLEKLGQLQSLYLDKNRISDINVLGNLQKLQSLSLRNNQVTDINTISKLQELKSIDFRSTLISDLKSVQHLIKKGISIKWAKYCSNSINIEGCPIVHPPKEVVKQGNEAILDYFKQIEDQNGTEPLYEAKLLIVGEPGAGKTTLFKKLIDPSYIVPRDGDKKIKSTVGINIKEGWSFPYTKDESIDFKTNLWDFGGQEVQYMTHHFFITPRAFYVLVADDRKQNTEFDYWFRIINLLARERDDERIKVLVVLNEINHQSVTNFDLNTYRENYPKLAIEKLDIDFSVDDYKAKGLVETIKKNLCELPHIGDPLPKLWRPIRQDLIKIKEKKEHITFEEFAALCSKERDGKKIEERLSQETLSGYLHRLGVILHYKEDDNLYDFVILNPQWAVDAVYAVLKDTTVVDNRGCFTAEDLKQCWRDYHPNERSRLLSLMLKNKFEICYESLQKRGTYIAPQLLPSIRPTYDWDSANTLKFRYQYSFMPKGLISRLIVRLSENIAGDGQLVWREGAYLEGFNCIAQVIQEKTVREGLEVLDMEVIGLEKDRKFLLRKIREEVKAIHKNSFKNISFEEMVPCCCSECCKSEHPHFYEYSVLLRYEQKKKREIVCDNSVEDVSVRGLLEGVFDEEEINQAAVEQNECDDITEQIKKEVNNFALAASQKYNKELQKQPQTLTPPVDNTSKQHKTWAILSIGAGFGVFLLGWWIIGEVKSGALVGLGAAAFMFFRNPDSWLKRLIWAALTAFIGTIVFNINAYYEGENYGFELSDPPMVLSIILGFIVITGIYFQVKREENRS